MKLFIDIETSGLPTTKGFDDYYPYTDVKHYESSRIMSIAFIYQDVTYYSTVKENVIYLCGGDAKNIHGLTIKDMLKGDSIKIIHEKLKAALDICDEVCTYNANFDVNVLASELHRNNFIDTAMILTLKKRVCVMKLFYTVMNQDRFFSLINAYKFLFDEEFDNHNALNDTLACQRVYLELKKRYKFNNGSVSHPK